MESVLAALVTHANENYERDGWDVLVECYSRQEILDELTREGITTAEGAIAHFGDILKIHDENRQDIEGEAF